MESSRIDYKAGWNSEPIIHTICAFANDIDNIGGGYIIIGAGEKNGMPEFPIKGLDRNSIDEINKDILCSCNLIEQGRIEYTEKSKRDPNQKIRLLIK